MAKQKIRNAGHRSKGGRKKLEGDRYPSGRLKPIGPNQLVVDRRKAPRQAGAPIYSPEMRMALRHQ